MLNFPIFEKLDIWDYGLFPGPTNEEPGLHINLLSGLTLVIGTNGLGKTTLVTILFRMLTGPYDIPGLTGGELGNIRLDPKRIPPKRRSLFANRVVDNARNSIARLVFRIGKKLIAIERRLRDLSLAKLSIDSKIIPSNQEEEFQHMILEFVGLSSFADWILLLRHLIFYFEDRRELVWDASAQRQVLRFLFLPPDISKKWTADERKVLTLDSQMRNLSAVLYREERLLAESQQKAEAAPGVLEELRVLEALQEVALAKRERLDTDLNDLESERQQARLRFLTAEQEYETRYRELERAKLIAVESRFPTLSETSRFILAQLMTEEECLACGSTAPKAATSYNKRLERDQCVVCGTELPHEGTPPQLADRRLKHALNALPRFVHGVSEARIGLENAEQQYAALNMELTKLSVEIAERSTRIDSLIRRLPPKDAPLHERHSEIQRMRGRVSSLRKELNERREDFREFISSVSQQLASQAEDIKQAFDRAAQGFLLENCKLVMSLTKQRVGETGAQIEFPVFELDMAGSDFASPVRRSGPEQVSESQREFIDIAFRMALTEVTSQNGNGSLVIDAPESSLDAVFVSRASNVLSQFAGSPRGNRLLITSNLVESKLIPELIQKTLKAGVKYELVNLLSIAVPTAAVRELRSEYTRVLDSLMAEAQDNE